MPNGLFGLSLPQHKTSPSKSKICATTVAENEAEFTRRDLKRAKLAMQLYKKIGRPGYHHFFHILDNNFLRNCPITSEDMRRAIYVYGPDVAKLKGRVTRQQPAHVPTKHLIPLPMHIRSWHRRVTLCIDIFYINKISFFLTTARNLKTITIQSMKSESYGQMLQVLQTAVDRYLSRGFDVQHIHCDGQFECLQDSLQPINFNIAAPEQHVPEIERTVRTLKDDIRTTVHGLPFPYFTRLMTKACAKRHVQLRNAFPNKDSVAKNISGHTLLTGLPPLSYEDFKLEFGAYCQAHEHPRTPNNPTPRSVGAIALGPANKNGGWHFMSLVTGQRITRYDWDLLPTPIDVIQRVTQIAKREKMPQIRNGLTFEWSLGNEIVDIPSTEISDHLRPAQIQGADTMEALEPSSEIIKENEIHDILPSTNNSNVAEATDVYENEEFHDDEELTTDIDAFQPVRSKNNNTQHTDFPYYTPNTTHVSNNNYYSVLGDEEDQKDHESLDASSKKSDTSQEPQSVSVDNTRCTTSNQTVVASENQGSDASEESENQRSEEENRDNNASVEESTQRDGHDESTTTASGIKKMVGII